MSGPKDSNWHLAEEEKVRRAENRRIQLEIECKKREITMKKKEKLKENENFIKRFNEYELDKSILVELKKCENDVENISKSILNKDVLDEITSKKDYLVELGNLDNYINKCNKYMDKIRNELYDNLIENRRIQSEIECKKKEISIKKKEKLKENENFIKIFNEYELEKSILVELKKCENDVENISKSILNKDVLDELASRKNYLMELVNLDNYINTCHRDMDKIRNELYENLNERIGKAFINKINSQKVNFDIKKVENKNIEKELLVLTSEVNDLLNRYNSSKFIVNKDILILKKGEIEKLINEGNIPDLYKINILKGYIKDIHAKEADYLFEENKNKIDYNNYQNIYAKYEILCEKLNISPTIMRTVYFDKIFEQINVLNNEVKNLTEKLSQKEDYDFIVQSVNEVMEELGYDIISSEVLYKVNRSIVDNIYSFDNNSILNVFTSDNGTIMFEVTGITNEKREMSSLEKLKIKESMDSFCTKYETIKKKLAERGIFFGKENLRPAEEKYARFRVVSKNKYKIKKLGKSNIKIENKNYI